MKMQKVAKVLCVGVMALSLCACGTVNDMPASQNPIENNENTTPAVPETSVSTVEEDIKPGYEETERNKVYMENNEMYDQQKRDVVFDTLYANCDGLEIWGEGDLDVDYKEGVIVRKLLFKNTTDCLVAVSIDDVERKDFSGSFDQYLIDYELINHPNGGSFFIEAGQEYLVQSDLSPFSGPVPQGTQTIDGELSYQLSFQIDIGADGNGRRETITLKQNITRTLDFALLREQNSDGVLRGTVTDEAGNPIEGASVSLIHPGVVSAGPMKTDTQGNYSFETGGYQTQYAGAWREASLVVEAPGYDKRVIPAYPKDGQEVVISPTMYKKSAQLYYEQTAVVDVGLQAYEYESDHNNTIAFVPFHTGQPSSAVKDRIRLTVTDFDGNTLFTHNLPEEDPYVDVSKDGQYVVSFEYFSSKDGFRTIIFDRAGNELFSITQAQLPEVDNVRPGVSKETPSRCAELSNDNQFLVVSDLEGRVWFMDWQNNQVLWSDFLDCQVRNIKFAPDNTKLYISSGNGYIYAYDINGKQLWKQFVQSWAPKMCVTEHYVVNTTKSSGNGLFVIDRETGDIKWAYPTQHSSISLSVSPDESMVWFGNHSSTGYSVLNNTVFDMETGKILYMLNGVTSTKAEFTKDGSKIISADSTNVYVNDAKTGALLWTGKVLDDYDASSAFALAANEDGTKFAVAMNSDPTADFYGQVYYFAQTDGADSANENDNISETQINVTDSSMAQTQEDVETVLKEGGALHVISDGELVLNGSLTHDVCIELQRGTVTISGSLEVSDEAGRLTINDGNSVDLRSLSIDNKITKEGEYHLIEINNCQSFWPVAGAISHNKPVKGRIILIEDHDHKELVYTK